MTREVILFPFKQSYQLGKVSHDTFVDKFREIGVSSGFQACFDYDLSKNYILHSCSGYTIEISFMKQYLHLPHMMHSEFFLLYFIFLEN